jgi:hypothetical protein
MRVARDRAGRWWTGEPTDDVDQYLRELES